jgi:hypothetical protein
LLAGSSTTPACSSVGVAAAAGAANQGAQACLQFEQIEGLGQVVVGAGVEPGDLVGAAVARREDQYRQRIAAFAQVLQHRQTIALRQAEVENAGLIGVVEQRQACGFAVTHPVDGVVGQLQAGTYAVTSRSSSSTSSIRTDRLPS